MITKRAARITERACQAALASAPFSVENDKLGSMDDEWLRAATGMKTSLELRMEMSRLIGGALVSIPGELRRAEMTIHPDHVPI